MERQALYYRFITLTWQEQLGNIASTLGKISKQVNSPEQDKLTTFLLREGALMIEWCASNVPTEYHLELAGLQKELLAWKDSTLFPKQMQDSFLLYIRLISAMPSARAKPYDFYKCLDC